MSDVEPPDKLEEQARCVPVLSDNEVAEVAKLLVADQGKVEYLDIFFTFGAKMMDFIAVAEKRTLRLPSVSLIIRLNFYRQAYHLSQRMDIQQVADRLNKSKTAVEAAVQEYISLTKKFEEIVNARSNGSVDTGASTGGATPGGTGEKPASSG